MTREALLLALADDELVMGHRLSEWTGWVPYIEEDLALSSIAQDEVGHARALYGIWCDLAGGDLDEVALGREPAAYRNAILCERPNRDFAYTVARHYLYDSADAVRLDALAGSSFDELAKLAGVLRIEEKFHLDHARAWLRRLATGALESRLKLGEALDAVLAEAPGLFEPVGGEEALVADGTMPRPSAALLAEWAEIVRSDLAEVGLDHLLGAHEAYASPELVPTASGEAPAGEHRETPTLDRATGGAGGRAGNHSEDFEPLWREMTGLYRAHRGARW